MLLFVSACSFITRVRVSSLPPLLTIKYNGLNPIVHDYARAAKVVSLLDIHSANFNKFLHASKFAKNFGRDTVAACTEPLSHC